MPWEELLRARSGRETQTPTPGEERRRSGSLIDQVAVSIGQTVDPPPPEDPTGTEPLLLPDGYLRRSPAQPYRTAADFRQRRVRKALGALALVCLVALLVFALLRSGLVKFK